MYVEMEEYLKRCESDHVTKKLQAWRATEEEEDKEAVSSKRRKFYAELKNEVHGGEVEAATTENSASPAASRTNSGGSEEFSSDAVKKRSSDLENVDNLQSENSGTEISSSIDRVFSREATPTSELHGDSEQILVQPSSTSRKKPSSSTPPANPRRKFAANTPSAAELEEFFAAAEKYDQKGFAEKYNYDIVKDVPLEGKYQWVRLHP